MVPAGHASSLRSLTLTISMANALARTAKLIQPVHQICHTNYRRNQNTLEKFCKDEQRTQLGMIRDIGISVSLHFRYVTGAKRTCLELSFSLADLLDTSADYIVSRFGRSIQIVGAPESVIAPFVRIYYAFSLMSLSLIAH